MVPGLGKGVEIKKEREKIARATLLLGCRSYSANTTQLE
jgi:hypothetical protein